MPKLALTPGTRLIVATSLIIVCLLLTILCAIHQPYSGLTLKVAEQGSTQHPEKIIRITNSIHSQIPASAELISIQAGAQPALTLTARDLTEDPHFLESYAAMQLRRRAAQGR